MNVLGETSASVNGKVRIHQKVIPHLPEVFAIMPCVQPPLAGVPDWGAGNRGFCKSVASRILAKASV